MGLIGHEIIQSRVWVDPTNPPPPNLNYKLTYPITIFDAVRRDMMDEDSETLTQVLEKIYQELKGKQSLIPAKPANYLVTHAGIAGEVGSIKISKSIPWEAESQSNNKIPTEKAVGDLIRKLGIDPSNPEKGVNVRWSDIIGRPNIYNELGEDHHGLISQNALSKLINKIYFRLDDIEKSYGPTLETLKNRTDAHISNTSNPHNITLSQIGAASAEALSDHVMGSNPHNINATLIGLGNVDNTRDIDKPISSATQRAIDEVINTIKGMTDDVGDLNFIISAEYNKNESSLELTCRNGSVISVKMPIENSIIDVKYDSTTKEIVTTKNDGVQNRINLSDLFIRYVGSTGEDITIRIDGDQVTGEQVIVASINPNSINAYHIADHSITNRLIENQAITSSKIRDYCISTIKYANRSITSEKIADGAVTTDKIADHSINGDKLFASANSDMILATIRPYSNPIWTKINSEMITNDAIQAKHISKHSITHDKLALNSIGSTNIEDNSITTAKIADKSITTNKLVEKSVTSEILAPDLMLEGTTKIRNTPNENSDNNEVVDTRWVRSFAKNNLVVETSNIAKRAITMDKIVSAPIRNRVLSVLKANQDPEWSTINNEMMEDNSIGTSNIIDKSITSVKIDDFAILSNHLTNNIIDTKHINDDSITSDKIYTSHEANRVLAALTKDGHPTYSQVTQDMIAYNSIGTMQLRDGEITLSKIKSSDVSQQVMTVGLKGSIPVWSKIMTQMIEDRAVDGNKLFSSETDNVVLAVTRASQNPTWGKLTGDMVDKNTITGNNIAEKSIVNENLADASINYNNIMEDAIQSKHIAHGAVKPELIESSPVPGRVIAVSGLPYSTPMWSQVNSAMIEDGAVTKEKIFKSKYDYHVLGVTKAGKPPEYLKISHQFIVDGTIIPEKLVRDFTLIGTPKLSIEPESNSDNYQLANTAWVRKTVANMIMNLPEWLPEFDFMDIPDHGIDGTKLFTHPYGPRVLGITEANADVEFILIEEDLIANGAVTTDKIQRSIHLLGSPTIEIRPSPNASDNGGDGQSIPDCQWVLDRIIDAFNGKLPDGSGSTSGDLIPHGSITSVHIQDRAVTADKIFTSPDSNRLLAVVDANSDPVYLQANNEMIADRAINGRTLFSSSEANKILAVTDINSDPTWTQINSDMISDKAIENRHISDNAISGNQIDSETITGRNLANKPIINETQLMPDSVSTPKLQNESVTNNKLADNSVTNSKIEDKSIDGNKLTDDIILPENTSIQSSNNYEERILRNTVISPNSPRGCRNGDIWFRFS